MNLLAQRRVDKMNGVVVAEKSKAQEDASALANKASKEKLAAAAERERRMSEWTAEEVHMLEKALTKFPVV